MLFALFIVFTLVCLVLMMSTGQNGKAGVAIGAFWFVVVFGYKWATKS